MFTHLHWHSSFSFLEAIGKPKSIIAKAKSLWMESIAITDYNGMYWSVNFYLLALESSIKPIIGTEFWFVMDINSINNPKTIWNIVLIAKNNQWYHNLMELVSFANQQWIKFKPKIDISILKQKNQWIIAIVWWEESWLGKMILNWDSQDNMIELIHILKEILWKENIFLEIIAQNEDILTDIKKINNQIILLSKETDTDCVINNNYFYPDKDEKEAWEMALAIKDWHKMYEENRRKPKWDYHIMNEDEIVEIMINNWYKNEIIQERIQNNNTISDTINIEIQVWQYLFPNYENPQDIKDIYEKNKEELIIK